MFDAVLTGMEAAMLRARGLTTPVISPIHQQRADDRNAVEVVGYRAVIITGTARIEALGRDGREATHNVLKLALR